jgi:hypothetical protein
MTSLEPPSHPVPIDVDALDETAVMMKIVPLKNKRHCEGLRIQFPPGKTPNSTYPFALHDKPWIGWNYMVNDGQMTLSARACKRILPTEAAERQCEECKVLDDNQILQGVLRRIERGVDENAPFMYQGHAGMVEVSGRKTRQIEALRLNGLNNARKLIGRMGSLDDYKRFVIALADGT